MSDSFISQCSGLKNGLVDIYKTYKFTKIKKK